MPQSSQGTDFFEQSAILLHQKILPELWRKIGVPNHCNCVVLLCHSLGVMPGIITAALNAYIRPKLAAILSPDTVALILKSTDTISSIPPETKSQVLQIFADGFQLQWKIVAGISGLQFLTCLLCV